MNDPEKAVFEMCSRKDIWQKSTSAEVALLLPEDLRKTVGYLSPYKDAGIFTLRLGDTGPIFSELNMMKIKYEDGTEEASVHSTQWDYIEDTDEKELKESDEPPSPRLPYRMNWTEFGLAVSRECFRLLRQPNEEEMAELEKQHTEYLQNRKTQ